MERQRLNELVKDPSILGKKDIAALDTLIERYPWFSSAHLLLAMSELNDVNIVVPEKIGRTAVGVPNRSPLFKVANQPNKELEATAPEEIQEPSEDQANESSTLSVVKDEPEIEVPSAEQITEPEQEHDLPLTKRVSQYDESDELDKLIRSEVAMNTVSIDLLQQKLDSFDPKDEKTKSDQPAEAQPTTEHPEESKSIVPTNGRLSFTQWLQPEGVEAPEAKSDPEKQLEEFIAARKQQATEKMEFFSPSKMAKRSLQDDEGMVTETLARIHEAQGNMDKAIDTYERLAEKHPERRSYFLSLVEKLKRDHQP